MDISFLAQADAITLQLEKAKRALEAAKADLETAKKAYDELLVQADEMGIPKAKLKKLTEDRIQSLFDSGLLDFAEGRVAPKEAKPRRSKVKPVPAPEESEAAPEVNESEAESEPPAEA